MADEPEADLPPVREQSGPGRYMALVLLILLIEGIGVYWVLDRAVPAPEVPPKEEEMEVIEKDVPWVKPIYFEGLKEMIVEPTAFRGNRMVQISLVLEVDGQTVVEELKLRQPVVWDVALRRLERLTEADLRDAKKQTLKTDLIQQINAVLKNPGVVAVYITDMIMQ